MSKKTANTIVIVGLLVMLYIFANVAMGITPDSLFDKLMVTATAALK